MEQKDSDYITSAKSFITLLTTKKFQECFEKCEETVQKAMPVLKLEETMKMLDVQFGEYKSLGENIISVSPEKPDGYLDMQLFFAKTEMLFRIKFNEALKVTSFVFLPITSQPKFVKVDLTKYENDISIKTGECEIFGQIDYPEGDGPFPAVLFVSGSGPNDRDGNSHLGVKSDYIIKIKDELNQNGFAVLRYDKRGAGRSVCKFDTSKLRFESIIEDTRQWIDLLVKNEKVSKIGIIGHSQGSLVGLALTSSPQVSFMISLAGAGEPIGKILRRQMGTQLKTLPDLLKRCNEIIESLEKQQKVDDVPPQLLALFQPSIQGFMMSWMKFDPVEIISKLEKPILIIQGTKDIQIIEEDGHLLEKGCPNATLKVIEGMNHVLRNIEKDEDQLPSYSNPLLPLHKELMPAVLEFLKEFQ